MAWFDDFSAFDTLRRYFRYLILVSRSRLRKAAGLVLAEIFTDYAENGLNTCYIPASTNPGTVTMMKPDASDKQQKSEPERMAEEVFSSEKREDIWALIIAISILILSVAFPDQIYHFFKNVLYVF